MFSTLALSLMPTSAFVCRLPPSKWRLLVMTTWHVSLYVTRLCLVSPSRLIYTQGEDTFEDFSYYLRARQPPVEVDGKGKPWVRSI